MGCVVLQRRIGATEDSDSSSEGVMDADEVQFEEQDSDSDEEGEHSQRVRYTVYIASQTH